ncbi:MAG: Zn-dependent hydrolase, partial [Tissierellales bacterium]|nr:Zn-dependent hydrolase [Tissierellales bacterium]
MKINISRLKNKLIEIGSIGKIENKGITRLAFSKEYDEARNILKNYMDNIGLNTEIDGVGNLIGTYKGKNSNLPSIIIASHLDTVPNGGLFDGALGIFAGLEVIESIKENNIDLDHNIKVIAFNAEEGSAMGGTFGSRAMTGMIDLDSNDTKTNLETCGLNIQDVEESIKKIDKFKSYLELHVSQESTLENEDISIGIPKGISSIVRYKIVCIGESNHAGTTLMKNRKDALIASSKLMLKIKEITENIGDSLVATVGELEVFPGAVNVIPGKVEMVLELRDIENKNIERAVLEIMENSKEISNGEFEFEKIIEKPTVMMNKKIVKTIEESCKKNSIDYKLMISGAGHDAKSFADKLPTAMIFVPSVDGKSHCPEEFTKWSDIEKGCKILLDTV